jgi:sulfatase modifying factor 1
MIALLLGACSEILEKYYDVYDHPLDSTMNAQNTIEAGIQTLIDMRLFDQAGVQNTGAIQAGQMGADMQLPAVDPPYIDMVLIHGGTFEMGSTRDTTEVPLRIVDIRYDFEISKGEISVGQYFKCVEAGICPRPQSDQNPNNPCTWEKENAQDFPMTCVSWQEARTFAKWMGGDLPSEAQWEFVASSRGKRKDYVWGNDFNDGMSISQVIQPSCLSIVDQTVEEVCDMAKNVAEMMLDHYFEDYSVYPNNELPWCNGDSNCMDEMAIHSVRGGDINSRSYTTLTARRSTSFMSSSKALGFRIVKKVDRTDRSQRVIYQEPRCQSCPNIDMLEVIISGDQFQMGSEKFPIEHTVNMQDSFMLSKSEITLRQYLPCAIAGICDFPSIHHACTFNAIKDSYQALLNQEMPSDLLDYPVNCISWESARKFSKWVGGDLPSEAQWEFIATERGRQTSWMHNTSACDDISATLQACGAATKVCSKTADINRLEFCDMIGNVSEFVKDEWHDMHANSDSDMARCRYDNCTNSASSVQRVNKGGNFLSISEIVVPQMRSNVIDITSGTIGFRVLKPMR